MRKRNLTMISVAAGAMLLAGWAAIAPNTPANAQQVQVSYSEDIVPIFKGWCMSCHEPGGEGYEASRLDLTSYESLMKGTKFGPMVLPGKPDESNLILLVMGGASPEIRMPFNHKPLPDCLRQNLWRWVFQGAKDN